MNEASTNHHAMTPTQLDHLSRIKRHLKTLLANAEKRTPGEWCSTKTCVGIPAVMPDTQASCSAVALLGARSFDQAHDLKNHKNDAAFIASCAGNAEAGWKSTLAAIAHLQLISQSLYLPELPAGEEAQNNADHALKIILAAWPIESLKP